MSPSSKTFLIQSGITEDNKPIYAGVYKFYETHGLPLDIILSCFKDKDWVPDWIDLYLAALAAGMDHNRILSKLESDISDSFGKEWADHVIFRLEELFKPKE
jgi:hypothetical protein